jgi:thiol-disulfide isomerase/thioredoxin
MKKSPRFFFPMLLALLLTGCDASDSKHPWQLDVYNPGSGKTETISAADMSHKLLVINYWAEWCKPCIEEIPELNKFADAEQDRVVVLGVNFDDKQGAALGEALQKVAMAYPAITSKPAAVFTLPEISGLPTTLIIDEHGVLKEQLLGPQSYESLQDTLHRHMPR